jgi:glutamate racemase
MGGLTVLKALRRELPAERFVYLGDTARLPYGTKSPTTVIRYAEQAAALLVARGVKALVVACNTASAFALDHLTRQFAPLPVFGVVKPGAHAAAEVADASGVLVLATESTIQGGAYQRALHAENTTIPVYGRACPLWVTLAEQGPSAAAVAVPLLEHYLRGFMLSGPRTLLLGCTHFPVFAGALAELMPDIEIVDSADTTARFVREHLGELGLLSASASAGGVSSGTEFAATDGVGRFRQVGAYFLGEAVEHVELVDL